MLRALQGSQSYDPANQNDDEVPSDQSEARNEIFNMGRWKRERSGRYGPSSNTPSDQLEARDEILNTERGKRASSGRYGPSSNVSNSQLETVQTEWA